MRRSGQLVVQRSPTQGSRADEGVGPTTEFCYPDPAIRLPSKTALALSALLLVVAIFYVRPQFILGTGALEGLDYDQLHIRRITFAQGALWGGGHTLPAWYPRELLGSPFAANLQSFPWIPTRLVLLFLDPLMAYAAGVAIAAGLAALFTFLFCRRAGLTRTAAFAAGGTFACAGYFASRVMAGHLPLLEAYPALPLLLWLVDRCFASDCSRRHRFDLALLALAAACVCVAGHPQVPAYAIASALLYTAWYGRGWQRARVAGAMVLGCGLMLVVWWPMLLLIGRSTRVLPLQAPDNDIGMAYGRLLALIVPGIHGWPEPVELAKAHPFNEYPDTAYFWDTASYVGILPLVAMAALFVACVWQRRMPDPRWRFLGLLGIGAFLCALPLASPLLHSLPGTLLRSPARLLYLWTFCAAVALGVGVDSVRPKLRTPILLAVLSLHFFDLWGFARWFVHVEPRDRLTRDFDPVLAREVGDGRIAEERADYVFSYQDQYDDPGGFDSIFLARTNRALIALSGDPPGTNVQEIDASDFPIAALEATGVRFVITTETRNDLQLVSRTKRTYLYRVPNPEARASFFGSSQIEFVDNAFAAHPRDRLLLTRQARRYIPLTPEPISAPATVAYARPSSDEILLETSTVEPGYVRLLEAFDPGWRATVDSTFAPVLPADGFAMAVPVTAGAHTIRLRYSTPGRGVGVGLSLMSLALLALLVLSVSVDTWGDGASPYESPSTSSSAHS